MKLHWWAIRSDDLLGEAGIFEDLGKVVNVSYCSLSDIIWKAGICIFNVFG